MTKQTAYRAIYKAGTALQFCVAMNVTSTSKNLLIASLKEKGINPDDCEFVVVR